MCFTALSRAQQPGIIASPNNKIKVQVRLDGSGQIFYIVYFANKMILEPSRLGIVRQDEDFTENLDLISYSGIKKITDDYTLVNSKRRQHHYRANSRTIHLKSSRGQLMNIIFQVSNDGVAFRYFFPGKAGELKKIESEITSFHFPRQTRGWLQPMSQAKTGWQQVNPC